MEEDVRAPQVIHVTQNNLCRDVQLLSAFGGERPCGELNTRTAVAASSAMPDIIAE